MLSIPVTLALELSNLITKADPMKPAQPVTNISFPSKDIIDLYLEIISKKLIKLLKDNLN